MIVLGACVVAWVLVTTAATPPNNEFPQLLGVVDEGEGFSQTAGLFRSRTLCVFVLKRSSAFGEPPPSPPFPQQKHKGKLRAAGDLAFWSVCFTARDPCRAFVTEIGLGPCFKDLFFFACFATARTPLLSLLCHSHDTRHTLYGGEWLGGVLCLCLHSPRSMIADLEDHDRALRHGGEMGAL